MGRGKVNIFIGMVFKMGREESRRVQDGEVFFFISNMEKIGTIKPAD